MTCKTVQSDVARTQRLGLDLRMRRLRLQGARSQPMCIALRIPFNVRDRFLAQAQNDLEKGEYDLTGRLLSTRGQADWTLSNALVAYRQSPDHTLRKSMRIPAL